MAQEDRRCRLGKRLNDRINGNSVKPKRIYHGNAIVQLFKLLIGAHDGFQQFPDSKPYLERLGIKVMGDVQLTELQRYWGALDTPEYECEIPDNLRVSGRKNETNGDMSELKIYDSLGREVIKYWVKAGREFELSVDLRGVDSK